MAGLERIDEPCSPGLRRAVAALADTAEELQRAACDVETIARRLHAERIGLAERYKLLTPEPLRTRIYARTFMVYGNRSGPTIDFLREQGKSWEEIIAGAVKPGAGPVPDFD